jgi:predicted phage tail protein
MAVVTLLGDLRQFGDSYEFAAATPAEIFSALFHQVKGFKKRLIVGSYRVLYRSKVNSFELDDKLFGIRLAPDSEIIITPVAEGAGKGGSGKILAGVAIIALAIITSGAASVLAASGGFSAGATAEAFGIAMASEIGFMGITYAQIAGFGAMMVLTGIYQMMMGSGTTTTSKAAQDANASYLFSGPINSSRQGGGKPLVFGRFICGSVVISSDLSAERIA